MRAGMLGEWPSPEALVGAAAALRRRGYRRLDAFTPYPVKGLEEALGLRRSRLGWIVFPLSLAGAGFGYLLQYWCNGVDYPLDVGGRPLNSAPAFIPITFEVTVLTAGLSALYVFLLLCRLPDLYSPVADAEGFARATTDGFWLGVDERDPSWNEVQIERDLRELGAVTVSRARGRGQ
jgi:hypothetical protein